MHISDEARRRAFSIWLRTGQLTVKSDIEVKFNPWHDPDNGRFTFAGAGQYYGRSGARSQGGPSQKTPSVEYVDGPTMPVIRSVQEAETWRVKELAKNGDKPGYREAIERRFRQYISKYNRPIAKPPTIDRTAQRSSPFKRTDQSRPRPSKAGGQSGFTGDGGGSFGGGGASGNWGVNGGGGASGSGGRPSSPSHKNHSPTKTLVAGGGSFGGGGTDHGLGLPAKAPDAAERAPVEARLHPGRAAAQDKGRRVLLNGYEWYLNSGDRLKEVRGTVSTKIVERRSSRLQRDAGGLNRRPTDDGGHYIAPRFNGPREAFNHFAQDSNLNRGRYRVLEDEWARADKAGKKVKVRIVPVYPGESERPSHVNIWFWVNGKRKSVKFANERKGQKYEK